MKKVQTYLILNAEHGTAAEHDKIEERENAGWRLFAVVPYYYSLNQRHREPVGVLHYYRREEV